jgi:hypothetical protein
MMLFVLAPHRNVLLSLTATPSSDCRRKAQVSLKQAGGEREGSQHVTARRLGPRVPRPQKLESVSQPEVESSGLTDGLAPVQYTVLVSISKYPSNFLAMQYV